ncbi:MAG: hypothetical protein IJB32_07025 [Clostridia bacterium]|nr:hypothetical protein [Clostridia bacterium]MBQ3596666.1 hypothetical protein [Clostridia bacterium]
MKKFLVAILSVCLSLGCFAMIGCNDEEPNNQPPHEHVFEDETDFYCDECSSYVVDTNEEFAQALAKTETEINIIVTADVTVDVTAWDTLAFGGENTTAINIKGENNNKITFNQLNSDWSNVVMKNANGVLSLENVTLTNSGHNDGPWNRHDINFGVDVKLTNVVSDKAFAFKKGATLKNVVINENNGDCYAIWIQPNGQTISIDGLVVNNDVTGGRGIKIDEQYVETPAKVILTVKNSVFKTNKKAAILVKSIAGAEIALSNVNIDKVNADSTNAVWVDSACSDYANLVVVTGGNKIVEA